MIRYKLPTDRMVNQLIPHIWGGRKLILFVQSLVYPLKFVNDTFVSFAKEKHIEARMTSQVMYMEWYLNHKFKKYFVDSSDRIFLSEGETLGVDLYREIATDGKPFTIWNNLGESAEITNPDEAPRELYFKSEDKAVNKVSFVVCLPAVTITQKEIVYLVSYAINTYKTAGKTYLIKIAGVEITPTI